MPLFYAFAAVALLFFVLSLLRSTNAPQTPRVVTYDTSKAGTAVRPPIPKTIWSYWHTDEQPLVVRLCVRNWAKHNPGYVIHVISARTLSEYVNRTEFPPGFETLTPARQSDWLRLYLLRRYGGIWVDSSIFLTRSLDWMIRAQQTSNADYVGFYIDRYTTLAQRPIVDSWCMAAPPDNPFINDWIEEFLGRAAAVGDAAYLDQLRQEGLLVEILQNLTKAEYLMIHVTAQRLLLRGGAYRLHLVRAEDSAFHYHSLSRWKRGLLFINLLVRPCAKTPPALIKLRGGERRKLEPYLRWKFFTRHSIAAKYLYP